MDFTHKQSDLYARIGMNPQTRETFKDKPVLETIKERRENAYISRTPYLAERQ